MSDVSMGKNEVGTCGGFDKMGILDEYDRTVIRWLAASTR
jgi:hypothetical protein